jgi:hypothetical protein
MQLPNVTFIIATYRRIDALRCTLRSLQLQTHGEWDAIVVGDCCGPETSDMIRTLADGRIRYYNLPERFGEQSGPNSFGLHLATGDYVCFLNHDDLLLADHLEYSLAEIVAAGSDFYFALAANAEGLTTDAGGTTAPVFASVLPSQKDLTALVSSNEYSFDPSSFWLVRTAYARAVGPWRHSSQLWRTPLRNWIMRAWRLGGVMSFGDKITGLRFWTQNLREGAPLYKSKSPEHEYMINLMENISPDGVREFIHLQFKEIASQRALFAQSEPNAALGRCFIRAGRVLQTELYLRFGIDYMELTSRLTGRQKGALHKFLLQKRTGESIPGITDISHLLENPESCRVL